MKNDNENIVGIIPLGGNATRMNHLPKFLLPCGIGLTLLDNILNIFQNNNINNIIAGVSETNDYILQNNNRMQKKIVNTKTMSETVFVLMNHLEQEKNDVPYKNILIMPDTFIRIKTEIMQMKNMLDNYDIVVLVYKIKDYQKGKMGQVKMEDNKIVDVRDKDYTCAYEYFWGSIGWNSTINKYINPEWETIGDLLKKAIECKIEIGCVFSDDNYYDCGTYDEYFRMIKNEI